MIWISIFLLSLVGVAIWYQRKTYIFQYLFFMRYPLIVGLILVLGPWFVSDRPDSLAQNFFVQKPLEIFITMLLAAWTALTVMQILLYGWMRIPFRARLPFLRKTRREYQAKRMAIHSRKPLINPKEKKEYNPEKSYPPRNSLSSYLKNPLVRGTLATLLTISVLIQCVRYSLMAGEHFLPTLLSGIGGVLFALILLDISVGIRSFISRPIPINGSFQRKVKKIIKCIVRKIARAQVLIDRGLLGKKEAQSGTNGFEIYVRGEGNIGFFPLNTFVFSLGTFILYAFGYVILNPQDGVGWIQNHFPALGYIIFLLMVICYLMSWLAFQFDKYRLPVEVGIFAVAAIFWGLSKGDHYYRMGMDDFTCSLTDYTPDLYANNYIPMASKRQKTDTDPMVLVAASGGGIKAAVWTTTVLTGLADQVPGFAKSIYLVSATSGGSVGAMYFVNGYSQDGPPSNFIAIRDAAAQRSLGAMAWGLVYPDFVRFLFPFVPEHLTGKMEDRGWAQETRWSQAKPFDMEDVTLNKWREGVKAGWRPAVVFNSTIAETGQQFMISNLDFHLPKEEDYWGIPRIQSFRGLYPGADLKVVTAARLSATFPWVTPISRPRPPDKPCKGFKPYHLADGGYYDNYSISSIVQFLQETSTTFVKTNEKTNKKVLLISIRANDTTKIKAPEGDSGFLFESLGPVKTMLSVRDSSQIARNNSTIHSLKKTLNLFEIVFELKHPMPLSWQLSKDQREEIEGYFWCQEIQKIVGEVAEKFNVQMKSREEWKLKEKECPIDQIPVMEAAVE